MSHIRDSASKVGLSCHQMRTEYIHRKYNTNGSPRLVSERDPNVSFKSSRTPLVETHADDDSPFNYNGERVTENLNADNSWVTILDEPITTDIQKENNIVKDNFHRNRDYNCHGQGKPQTVPGVSPSAIADSESETTNPKPLSKIDAAIASKVATISNVDFDDLKHKNTEEDSVAIVLNDEAGVADLEVPNSTNSGYSSLFVQLFSSKFGKRQKEVVKNPSSIEYSSSELSDFADHECGDIPDESVVAKIERRPVSLQSLEALQPAPHPSLNRSFEVYNVIGPDHLHSNKNLPLPVRPALQPPSPWIEAKQLIKRYHRKLVYKSRLWRARHWPSPSYKRLWNQLISMFKKKPSKPTTGRTPVFAGGNLSHHNPIFMTDGTCPCVNCVDTYKIEGPGGYLEVLQYKKIERKYFLSTYTAATRTLAFTEGLCFEEITPRISDIKRFRIVKDNETPFTVGSNPSSTDSDLGANYQIKRAFNISDEHGDSESNSNTNGEELSDVPLVMLRERVLKIRNFLTNREDPFSPDYQQAVSHLYHIIAELERREYTSVNSRPSTAGDAGHTINSDTSDFHQFTSFDTKDEIVRDYKIGISSNGWKTFGGITATQNSYVGMSSDYLSDNTDSTEVRSSVEDEARSRVFGETLAEIETKKHKAIMEEREARIVKYSMTIEERDTYKLGQLKSNDSIPLMSSVVASIKAAFDSLKTYTF